MPSARWSVVRGPKTPGPRFVHALRKSTIAPWLPDLIRGRGAEPACSLALESRFDRFFHGDFSAAQVQRPFEGLGVDVSCEAEAFEGFPKRAGTDLCLATADLRLVDSF